MRPVTRTDTRTAVVWEALHEVASGLPAGARVLDIGGGTGGFAVRLAGLPLSVTVVDPSPDALAALARRAAEAGVSAAVTGIQGDLADVDLREPADLVLCHGVLGLLADPAAGLETLGRALRPGGVLSLVVGQLHAAVLARAMAGHVRAASDLLRAADRPDAGPRGAKDERRFTVDQLRALLAGAGLQPIRVQGVRVFADLVPGALLDLEAGASEALLELERAAADRPAYHPLATQLHVLATG